jgi:hypothetical protein
MRWTIQSVKASTCRPPSASGWGRRRACGEEKEKQVGGRLPAPAPYHPQYLAVDDDRRFIAPIEFPAPGRHLAGKTAESAV